MGYCCKRWDTQCDLRVIWLITRDHDPNAAQHADLVSFDRLLQYFTGIGVESAPHLLWDSFSGGTAAVVKCVLSPFATPIYYCMFHLVWEHLMRRFGWLLSHA